jgi:hypothetical protein
VTVKLGTYGFGRIRRRIGLSHRLIDTVRLVATEAD